MVQSGASSLGYGPGLISETSFSAHAQNPILSAIVTHTANAPRIRIQVAERQRRASSASQYSSIVSATVCSTAWRSLLRLDSKRTIHSILTPGGAWIAGGGGAGSE